MGTETDNASAVRGNIGARSRSKHVRMAVTDHKAGTKVLVAPRDRTSALRLRSFHRKFWCSTQAGGCGGELALAAGKKIRPYFRHVRSASGCFLQNNPHLVERSYAHVRYQDALLDWLRGQGFEATAERVLGEGGRCDVHVVLVDAGSQSIEVQLSPIGDRSWAERDALYRSQVDQVSWLYGSGAESAAARELALRGVALLIRMDDGVQVAASADTETEGLTWHRLDDCWLDERGFQTPDLDEQRRLAAAANAEAQRREEARRTAAREERDRQLREKEEHDRLDGDRRQQEVARARQEFNEWTKARSEWEQKERERRKHRPGGQRSENNAQSRGNDLGSSTTVRDPYPWSLTRWMAAHPEAKGWVLPVGGDPSRDALPLTPREREAANFFGYLVSTIFASGPMEMFTLEDLPSPERVIEAMEVSGLLVRTQIDQVARWERGPACQGQGQ